MAARAVITMSPEQYLAGLKQLEAATNKSANKMENSFKQYGTSINKAGIAMRYVFAERCAGAVAVGRAFQVLAGGKIAIAVAAIAGAFVALKKYIDVTSVSEKERAQILDNVIEEQNQEAEALKKTQKEEETLMERLEGLNSREVKTNEETTEQIRLAEILVGKYGKLGISVDDLTGNYEDMATAMEKIREQQKQDQITSLETRINAQTKRTIVTMQNKIKKENATGYTGMLRADDLRKIEEEGIQGALDVASYRYSKAKTEDEIAYWNKKKTELKQIMALQKELDSLNQTGYLNPEEEAKARKKASDASREKLNVLEKEAAIEHQMLVEQEEADEKHAKALAEQLNKEEEIERKRKQAIDDRKKDDQFSLKFAYMRFQGKNEQAAIQEALYNEARDQGLDYAEALDPALAADITQRTKARLALERLQNTAVSAPELYAPRVNSLIARGGSAAPVKMPKVEEYQAKTLSAVDKMAKDTGFIRNYLQDNGLI